MCSAKHPALIDEMITDIHCITCRNLANLQNNTTACFDRMVTNLTTLCYRLHNVPELACKLQSATLNKMKYKIITALGTSQKLCSTNKQKPIHGTGQGSEASGSNWLFTSVPMINTIEQNCKLTWINIFLVLLTMLGNTQTIGITMI